MQRELRFHSFLTMLRGKYGVRYAHGGLLVRYLIPQLLGSLRHSNERTN